MLTTKEVRGVKVVRPNKPGKEYTKDGLPRHRRKIGKIYKTVFSPDGLRVVGFIVRRPDLLWMFKRPERFLALDALDVQDGLIVPSRGADSWDDRAIKRMDVDYDTCIIWEGIQVKTSDGANLGHVSEISFDEKTGDLNSLYLDDGGAARALIGAVEIPAELMVGYKKGMLVVKPEAADLLPSGGLAAKAGEATAKIGQEAREGAAKAGQAASKAVDAGTYGIGKALGSMKRSVTGAIDGYKVESGSAERAAQKKAAAQKEAAAAKKTSASTAKASSGAKKDSSSGAAAKAKGAASSGAAKSAKSAASANSSKSGAAKAKASSSKSSAKSVGEAVSDHMKGVGSMFSDFKKEFDKNK